MLVFVSASRPMRRPPADAPTHAQNGASADSSVRPSVALLLCVETDLRFSRGIHDAVHSVDDLGFVEVDQKSQRTCSQFQVGKQLRFVHWKHGCDRLHFDNNAILD